MQNVLNDVTKKLSEAQVSSPRLEARIIIGHVLGMEANDVLFSNRHVSEEQLEDIYNLLADRLNAKPIDKIIGKRDFYKNTFIVNEDVLSPRPDTEVLVEEALKHAVSLKAKHILDLGTGSGCILLSILGDIKELLGVGVDASSKALKIAVQNAENLKLSDRVKFVNASWFDEDFCSQFENKFDIIVSNPPYIPSEDIKSLNRDVKEYDPMMALDGGITGLDHYLRIAEVSKNLLRTGGEIFLEFGINQASDVIKIFEEKGFQHLQTLQDLAYIERCVVLKKL